MPTDEEVVWLSSVMAARMLADAASDARQQQLYEALGFWLLDSVSPQQRMQIARRVQEQWRKLAALVDLRNETLQEKGKSKPLSGCEGRV